MKKVLPLLALLVSFDTFSGECKRRDQTQCGRASTSVGVYEMITRRENSSSDVKKAISNIERISRSTGFDTQILGEMYVDILRALGGASSTSDAISILQNSESVLRQGVSPINVSNVVATIASVENSTSDVRDALSLVGRLSEGSNSLFSEIGQAYADSLRALGGSTSTAEALNAIREMKSYANIWYFSDMTDSLKSLASRENSASDALANLKLVLRASEFCDDVAQPTRDFNSLLRSNGGSRSTSETQSAFRAIYNI